MRETITNLAAWPHRINGRPILRTSNEALLYAQLIFKDPEKQDALVFYRDEGYRKLRKEREKQIPDYQSLMGYAVEAQMFGECFIHTLRIRDEESKTEGA